MSETEARPDVTALTVQLLSAYLVNNTVASGELASLIRTTKSALTDDLDQASVVPVKETFAPAVTARKSLSSPDHILSLIDGKPYKTLKRHLARHGLTPETYRERYNLPSTYPMVAPSFTAKRREIAHQIGLGSIRKLAVAKVQAAAQTEPVPKAISEASPAKATVEKKAARIAKPRTVSTEPTLPKSAVTKAPAEKSSKSKSAAKKPAAKRSESLSKNTAPAESTAKKSVMPAADAKPEPATAEAAKAAPRAKLGLFRDKAADAAGEVTAPPAHKAASNETEPASAAPKAKRMARMPAASSQG